jgi:hypothetical protein
MVDENTSPPNGKRPLIAPPSAATTIGTVGGVGLGPIVVWALTLAHVIVPPEVAASIGAVVGNLVGYFFEGGRKQS